MRPLIGITAALDDARASLNRAYADGVAASGGVPVALVPPDPSRADPASVASELVSRLDGIVLTGGSDPRTEAYDEPTHPSATTVHPHRQAFEEALLRALGARPATPVLGVCLGMQMMALHAGGALHQHLPEVLPASAPDHREDRIHGLRAESDPVIRSGSVNSNHHQAVRDPGALRVVAFAHDGVIEAVRDPSRPFALGVQWHPERMGPGPLGWDLFRALVEACTRPAR